MSNADRTKKNNLKGNMMYTVRNMVLPPSMLRTATNGSGWGDGKSQERRVQRTPVIRTPLYADAPINILIVDDEPKNLTVLETVLDDPGYRLVRAESANHALLALVEEEFALLILDIGMPGMNGFELAKMVKERKKTSRIPIIFLTAYYNEDQHVLEGYSTGAVDYLHKPVNPAVLRSKVAVFAELHRKNREYAIANRALLVEVSERRKAQEQLRELNESLEQRVTERTEALLLTRTALNETGERYRLLFESSLDAIVSLDKEGRFLDANPAMVQLSGRSLEELKSMYFFNLCPPELQESTRNAFYPAFCNECITVDTTILTVSGERRDLFMSVTPALNEGKIMGVSCIARDVTERKRAEEELKKAKVEAEKANLAKSDFLSKMSHELRTPLNAILGFAQLLEAGSPPPTADQATRLQQIIIAGWYLLELINEILDLAVIESGKLTLSPEAVSLQDVLHECQTMIESEAEKRQVKLEFCELDADWVVYADRTRLKQVMLNLLSNAIKYNRTKGSVEVTCIDLPPDHLRITIKDSGEGLTPEKMQQLFQPFNRLGQETGNAEGTGIGLVVAKQLVELMGGTIGVNSEVGKGSEFWIELRQDTARSGNGDAKAADPEPQPN